MIFPMNGYIPCAKITHVVPELYVTLYKFLQSAIGNQIEYSTYIYIYVYIYIYIYYIIYTCIIYIHILYIHILYIYILYIYIYYIYIYIYIYYVYIHEKRL